MLCYVCDFFNFISSKPRFYCPVILVFKYVYLFCTHPARVEAAEVFYSDYDENLHALLFDLITFLKAEKAFRNKMIKVYRLAKEEAKYREKANSKSQQAQKYSSKARKAGQKIFDTFKQ